MWLNKLYNRWVGPSEAGTHGRPARRRQHRARLTLERLEERALLSDYSASTVPELIAAINSANQSSEVDTIALVAGRTFTLTEMYNNAYWAGATGLPAIVQTGGGLSILGNSSTIERSTAEGTSGFRLFYVEAGASLTLENLTLQGGVAAEGGAIKNGGTLTLKGVTVQNNAAIGSWYCAGGGQERPTYAFTEPARGGGIYSTGTLSLENSTIQKNQAVGQPSRSCDGTRYSGGGAAFGGGLFLELGSNTALHNSSVTENSAIGGQASGKKGSRGSADGGGVYIDPMASVCLDAFTEAHTKRNRPNNFYGLYTICS